MGQSRKDLRATFVLPSTNIFTSEVNDDGIETAIETTDAYVSVLKLDVRGYRKIIIEVRNDDASNAIDIQALGSRKSRDAVALSESFWDGSSNDFRLVEAAQTALAAVTYATDIEFDLKLYSFVVLQAKANVGSSQGDARVRATLTP